MKKILTVFLLIFTFNNLSAQGGNERNLPVQDVNVEGAAARLDRAVASSQEEFSMQDSYFLGRTVAAHILSRFRIYSERSDITNYLNLICTALAVNSPAPNWFSGYNVTILNDPNPNAFSTPGGHIFITRGFINLAVSEDMLAAIIAHEMAHIQLEHGIAEIMNSRVVQNLQQEQSRLSRELDTAQQRQMFTQAVNEVVDTILGSGYSQLQEYSADEMAVNLLALAGYNPGSLIELLRIMERLPASQMAGLNNTHPLPAQRISNLQRTTQINIPDTSSARRNRFNRIMGR